MFSSPHIFSKIPRRANADVDGAMLANFLDTLEITGASRKIKRVIVTSGAKQYGIHLGAPQILIEDSDLWEESDGRPPNFYDVQQKTLHEEAKRHGWEWVVTYPNNAIGVAKGSFIKIPTSLVLHAAISKELDGNLMFQGSETILHLLRLLYLSSPPRLVQHLGSFVAIGR